MITADSNIGLHTKKTLCVVKRTCLQIFAVLLILYFFVPFPGGAFTVTAGMAILACTSLRFALYLQRIRFKFRRFDQALRWGERNMGQKIAGGLAYTRPESNPRENIMSCRLG